MYVVCFDQLALVNKTLLQLAETVNTLQTDSSRTALSDLQDQMNQLSRVRIIYQLYLHSNGNKMCLSQGLAYESVSHKQGC